MPVPAPSGSESQSQFMHRCMSDAKMQSEYPRQDQRVAICLRQWRDQKAVKVIVGIPDAATGVYGDS